MRSCIFRLFPTQSFLKQSRLLFLVVLQVFCLAVFSLSDAAERDKKPEPFARPGFEVNVPGKSEADKKYFDQESVKKIQESLKVVGYDPGEIFGLIGEKTSAAMRQFRADFEIVSDELFSDQLITTLFHYADVAKIHPDWKDITLSKSFTDWIDKQPSKEQVRISKLRRSGTSQQIIMLLNAYKSDQKEDKKTDETAAASKKKADLKKPEKEKTPEAVNADAVIEKSAPKAETKKEDAAKVEDQEKPASEIIAEAQAVQEAPPKINTTTEVEATEETTSDSPAEGASETPAKPEAKNAGETPAESEAGAASPLSSDAGGQTQPPANSEEGVSFQNILEQAKHLKAFDPSKMIEWEGEDCGCLRDLSGRTIYGFYPFWQAGKPQKINFSLLSRIGYYALSFDSKGEMSPLLHWHHRTADFVTESQRYRTKVDLVIYKNDWSEWFHFSTKDQLFVIDKTTRNIVRAVDQKMPDTLENRAKSLASSKDSTTMGDGVTLYFDEYPEDARAVVFFEAFIKTLRKKLKAANPKYKLNLMLPMHAIGTGIYTFENLEKFMHDENTVADDDIDLFLVMLEMPTTDTKKALRLSFEQGESFKGIQRKNMLRKIVPVISPLGHEPDQYKQFEDDLIYFEDNFGGVGFWPLPFAEDKGAEIVEQAVREVFVKKTDLDFIERMVPEAALSPCKWICPNRWYVRLAYDALAFLLFLYALLALRSAALRNFFNQNKRYFIASAVATIVIFYSALMCDPYLSNKKDEVTLALIFVGVFFFIWRNYMRMKESEYP